VAAAANTTGVMQGRCSTATINAIAAVVANIIVATVDDVDVMQRPVHRL
jgi:hypothetical protein